MADVVTLAIDIDSSGAVRGAQVVSGSLRQVRREAARTSRSLDTMEAGFGGLRRALLSLKGTLATLGLGLFVREVVQANLAFQQIESTLFTASENVTLVGSDFKFVQAESRRLGINIRDIGIEFARLAAAAKGTSLEGQTTRDIFSATSEAFVATGQSSEQLRLAIFALQQMISKGRVQSEELRGQFGERLPGAFDAARRAMGASRLEFVKMLEAGEILPQDLLPKLAAELRKTFGPGFEAALARPRVALGRFANEVAFFLNEISKGGGFMRAFVDQVNRLTELLQGPEGQALAEFLGSTLAGALTLAGNALEFLIRNSNILLGIFAALATSTVVRLILSLWKAVKLVTGAIAFLLGLTLPGRIIAFATAIGSTLVGALIAAKDATLEYQGVQFTLFDVMETVWGDITDLIDRSLTRTGNFIDAWLEETFGEGVTFDAMLEFAAGIVKASPVVLDDMLTLFNKLSIIIIEWAKFLPRAVLNALKDVGDRIGKSLPAILFQALGQDERADAIWAEILTSPLDFGFAEFDKKLKEKVDEVEASTFFQDVAEKVGKAAGDYVDSVLSRTADRVKLEEEFRQEEERFRLRAEMLEREAQARRNAAAAANEAAAELSRKEQALIDRADKRIAKLETEYAFQERLNEAFKNGADSVAALEAQREAELAVIQAGLTLSEQEGSARRKRADEIYRLVYGLELLKTAYDELEDAQREQQRVIDEVNTEYEKLNNSTQVALDAVEKWAVDSMIAIQNLGDEARRVMEEKIKYIFTERQKEILDEALQDSRDFVDGWKRSLQEYADAATDAAAGIEDVLTNAFSNLEDVLVDFFTTGKADFKEFIDALLRDLVRLIIRLQILGPLARALSGFSFFGLEGGPADLGVVLGFQKGGVMRGVEPFAHGGIARSPTLAMFGEGSQAEAFVPLPDGKNIPVKLDESGFRNVVINFNIATQDANSFKANDSQVLRSFSQRASEVARRLG